MYYNRAHIQTLAQDGNVFFSAIEHTHHRHNAGLTASTVHVHAQLPGGVGSQGTDVSVLVCCIAVEMLTKQENVEHDMFLTELKLVIHLLLLT